MNSLGNICWWEQNPLIGLLEARTQRSFDYSFNKEKNLTRFLSYLQFSAWQKCILCSVEKQAVWIMLTQPSTALVLFFFFTSQIRKKVMIHPVPSESKFILSFCSIVFCIPHEKARVVCSANENTVVDLGLLLSHTE